MTPRVLASGPKPCGGNELKKVHVYKMKTEHHDQEVFTCKVRNNIYIKLLVRREYPECCWGVWVPSAS